jgi:hypothetical protein
VTALLRVTVSRDEVTLWQVTVSPCRAGQRILRPFAPASIRQMLDAPATMRDFDLLPLELEAERASSRAQGIDQNELRSVAFDLALGNASGRIAR